MFLKLIITGFHSQCTLFRSTTRSIHGIFYKVPLLSPSERDALSAAFLAHYACCTAVRRDSGFFSFFIFVSVLTILAIFFICWRGESRESFIYFKKSKKLSKKCFYFQPDIIGPPSCTNLPLPSRSKKSRISSSPQSLFLLAYYFKYEHDQPMKIFIPPNFP